MIPRWLKSRPKKLRGQAMAETVLLTALLLGAGGALMHFFPDSMTAMQIYIDGFYFTFALPIP